MNTYDASYYTKFRVCHKKYLALKWINTNHVTFSKCWTYKLFKLLTS